MKISGLSKLTLLDYPEHIACTVFTGSCNFRCPYCHNAGLVLNPNSIEPYSEDEFFEFLSARRGKLEGVCITGGEPTLQKNLSEFVAHIQELGFKVKLDTNGYEPDILFDLISDGLLDMVAMDIKNCSDKYSEAAGVPAGIFDLSKIRKSMRILRDSGIPHEFRTTVVRELHTATDIERICLDLYGDDSPYFLQTFKPSDEMMCIMNGSGENYTPYSAIEMRKLLGAARNIHPNVHIRGEED